jgi:hypothetical protein
MVGEGGPYPFLNYTLAFALQKRESTKNLSQGSRVVADYSLRRHGRLLGTVSDGLLDISAPRLPVGDSSQRLVGTGAFQVAELSGSPHQLTLSRNSVSALMWSAKN